MAISKLNPTSAVGVNYEGGEEVNRPASPTVGSTFYNTTVESLQIWDGASWNTISVIDETPVWTTPSGNILDATEASAFTVTVVATDPEGGVISYSSTTLPAWASINSSTGVISGTTPSVSADETATFSIIASDVNLNKTSRTFNIITRNAFLVDALTIVSGGGGGGHYGINNFTVGCGGGGAGGVKTFTNAGFIPGTPHTVTVGAGGTRRSSSLNEEGNDGNPSSAGTFSTTGGGGGAKNDGASNRAGGSGGGGARGGAGGLGISGEGNNGNPAGGFSSQASGSGGGGKAGAGTSTVNDQSPGNGGAGTTIEGHPAGGGGGGGSTNVPSAGTGLGGSNGGGNGSAQTINPVDGTANTGGGGGGNARGGPTYPSSAGGSGFVLLKYADSKAALTATTGSPTYTVSGGFRFYYFTGSGSFTV